MVEDSTGPVGQQFSASRLVSIERASYNRNTHTRIINNKNGPFFYNPTVGILYGSHSLFRHTYPCLLNDFWVSSLYKKSCNNMPIYG